MPAQVLSAVHPAAPSRVLAAHAFRERAELVFRALFTIRADGTSEAEMTESTGSAALDALALEAARRWTFRPATQDGVPVESFLRLRVEFEAI